MIFDDAVVQFQAEKIGVNELVEAWINEFRFCYAKFCGCLHVLAVPTRREFGFVDIVIMGRHSRRVYGTLMVSVWINKPEDVARGVVAYEGVAIPAVVCGDAS